MTGDTSEMNGFWEVVNSGDKLDALLIECAFPNELEELAQISHHLTPKHLLKELKKLNCQDCPIYVINIKPMYREEIVRQIEELKIENMQNFGSRKKLRIIILRNNIKYSTG